MRRFFGRLHRFLLPPNPHLGVMPYVYLIYLGFFFIRYFFIVPSASELAMVVLTLGLFFYLYFTGYWRCDARQLINVWGIAALGAIFAPINPGASVFIIYAGAFSPFVGSSRVTLLNVIGLLALVWIEALLIQPSPVFWIPAAVFTPLVALANHHYATIGRKESVLRRTQAEVRRMAQVAERERIARDLHDLLGHTLSVITLKSELAAKLIDRDSRQAAEEVRDVERISREALAQVREAVTGYRRHGLQGEIDSAGLALKAAGIELCMEGEAPEVDARVEAVLAMVIREAVTNVIRHANARSARITWAPGDDSVGLRVHDDGRGGIYEGGSGLDGMRERVENLGGTMRIERDGGTRLEITVPRTPEPDREFGRSGNVA